MISLNSDFLTRLSLPEASGNFDQHLETINMSNGQLPILRSLYSGSSFANEIIVVRRMGGPPYTHPGLCEDERIYECLWLWTFVQLCGLYACSLASDRG